MPGEEQAGKNPTMDRPTPSAQSEEAVTPWPADHPARPFCYRLLARLLAAPPSLVDLGNVDAVLINLQLPETLAGHIRALSRGLQSASLEELNAEYHNLFVGNCRGELLPYASWYRCGGLLGPSLLEIRTALASLGVERQSGASEPEDHASALLETMAIMLEENRVSSGNQADFFQDHLDPWIHELLSDLRRAPSSSFYTHVAALGSEFLAAERCTLQAG